MRKLFLSIIALTLGIGARAQNNQCIEIGIGTQPSFHAPYNTHYKYSLNQTIYLKDEIGTSGKISQIAYYCSEAGVYGLYCQSIRIYMGHTTKTTFAGSSDYIDASNFTLVFSREGYIIGKATDWEVITLDSEFEYNGTNNLVVCVCKSAERYSTEITYRYTSSASSVLYRNSDINSDYADITITNGSVWTMSDQKANIRLYITETTSLPEKQAEAIDEIDDAIEGITDETILAIANKAKTDINAATTIEDVDAIKNLAIAKINALVLIQTARQGIQNTEINAMINDAVNIISSATTEEQIDDAKLDAMTIIGLFQNGKAEGKAEALGPLGEEHPGPAVKVTKDDTEVILYLPDKVEYIIRK